MPDEIHKTIELNAPVERVWRAITDHGEFGQWFKVNLEGPFRPGEESRGHMTYPGYEHIVWRAKVVATDEPHLFSFNWHPYAIDPNVDYSKETPTLVEFRLAPAGQGTSLTITETGFEGVPEHRREEAMRRNDGGWTQQIQNIKAHVDA